MTSIKSLLPALPLELYEEIVKDFDITTFLNLLLVNYAFRGIAEANLYRHPMDIIYSSFAIPPKSIERRTKLFITLNRHDRLQKHVRSLRVCADTSLDGTFVDLFASIISRLINLNSITICSIELPNPFEVHSMLLRHPPPNIRNLTCDVPCGDALWKIVRCLPSLQRLTTAAPSHVGTDCRFPSDACPELSYLNMGSEIHCLPHILQGRQILELEIQVKDESGLGVVQRLLPVIPRTTRRLFLSVGPYLDAVISAMHASPLLELNDLILSGDLESVSPVRL